MEWLFGHSRTFNLVCFPANDSLFSLVSIKQIAKTSRGGWGSNWNGVLVTVELFNLVDFPTNVSLFYLVSKSEIDKTSRGGGRSKWNGVLWT